MANSLFINCKKPQVDQIKDQFGPTGMCNITKNANGSRENTSNMETYSLIY